MSKLPGQSDRCASCGKPYQGSPQLTLEYLRELKAAKREPVSDLITSVSKIRLRALQALAFRVRALDFERTQSGCALVGPFGWDLLIEARDRLAEIDERDPPPQSGSAT